jgi:hypothetical protein
MTRDRVRKHPAAIAPGRRLARDRDLGHAPR